LVQDLNRNDFELQFLISKEKVTNLVTLVVAAEYELFAQDVGGFVEELSAT